MPINYCPSCGAGNKYDLTAPKFCNQCGSGFQAAVAKVAAPTKIKPKLRPVIEDDDDDDEYDSESYASAEGFTIPKKLDIEISVEPMQKQTLGSIMTGSEEGFSVSKTGKRISKRQVKEKLDAWRTKLQTTQRHDIGGKE